MIVIILIVLIIVEVFFFIDKEGKNKMKVGEKQETIAPEVKNDDEKYIVDLFTPYELNSLEYKEVKDDNITYLAISGLKNKEVEDKINNKIKEKTYSLTDNLIESSSSIYTRVVGSFENVLSMEFVKKVSIVESGYEHFRENVIDTYNCELNNGDELLITDLILSKTVLRTELVNNATKRINRNIGFVCDGGPCTNPEPDYSKVEDSTLAIVNLYNKDDYFFSFTEGGITLYFSDVYVPNPIEKYPDEDGADKCKIYYEKYEYDDEEDILERYICQDNYDVGYETFINFYKMIDNVIIYDKYKKEDNIFNGNREQVNRKFMKTNIGNDDSMYEVLEENDTQLIDYNLNTVFINYLDNKVIESLKNKVVEESSELKQDKFNIYNINGDVQNFFDDKYYVYFEVTHYNLDKDIYLSNKKQIYSDKYEKMKVGYIDTTTEYKAEYDYLSEYMTKRSYYFYIIDDNGKEYNCSSFINFNFDFNNYISNEWLSLGKYKSMDSLVRDALIVVKDIANIPDRLVIFMDDRNIIFKYKGREVVLVSSDDPYYKISDIKEKLFK